MLAADHARLIANAVRWALGKRPTSRSKARAVARSSPCATSDDGVAVVLNNLTNPMMMKGPIREVYPGRPARPSRWRCPTGRQLARRAAARRRPQGQGARVGKGRVEIEVPGIDTIEVVHITWT